MSARDVIACFLDHPSVFMGGPSERNQRKADAILAALSAAGWVVVPREPTPGMTLAANKRVAVVTPDGTWALGRDEAARTWATMIAAAVPAAPEARDDGGAA